MGGHLIEVKFTLSVSSEFRNLISGRLIGGDRLTQGRLIEVLLYIIRMPQHPRAQVAEARTPHLWLKVERRNCEMVYYVKFRNRLAYSPTQQKPHDLGQYCCINFF